MSEAVTVEQRSDELIPTPLLLMVPNRVTRIFERHMREMPSLMEIKTMIEPLLGLQPLEHVNVFLDDQYLDMFVDEMSAVNALPRNDEATKVYRNNWLVHNPNTDPETLPAIYGPAVIALRKIWT